MYDYNHISKLIEPFYPEYPLLSLGDIRFPVYTIPSQPLEIEHPNSILGPLDTSFVQTLDPIITQKGEEHIRNLTEQGVALSDLPTYCLTSLDITGSGSLVMRCHMDTYFNMLRTCETLWQELKDSLVADRRDAIPVPFVLRHRLSCLGGGSTRILSPKYISAAIGISTLIVFRKGGGYSMFVGKRGNTGVALGRGGYHVAPACMFQPVAGSPIGEYDIVYNVYREYLEEIFSIEEENVPGAPFSKTKVLGNPNIEYLSSLGSRGLAGLYLTGITFNLLTLRPEVSTLLLIRDGEWHDSHTKGTRGLAQFKSNAEWNKLEEAEIDSDPKQIDPARNLPAQVTATGAGVIYLGLECLKEII